MAKGAPFITAIDVGTTKVCTIVGTGSSPSRLKVLAHSTIPSRGLRKGNVVDSDAVTKSIRSSLDEVESQLGQKISSAYIGVTGAHVTFENRKEKVRVGNDRNVVTSDDLARAPVAAAEAAADSGRQLLHAIVLEYSVENEGIRNPVGMHAQEIEVDSHLITGASSYVDKLVRAVEGAGITLDGLVLEPLASGQAVLTPQERERGVVVVDIGGGTTDVVGFLRGKVFYTAVIPVGGYQFTNDIAFVYDTTYEAAEDVKLKHVGVDPRDLGDGDAISLPINDSDVLKVPRRDICKLARERAQELVKLIGIRLREAEIGPVASMRLVLTGGASSLQGLQTLVEHGLTKHVRMGGPDGSLTLPDELRGPAHSTAVGILLWAIGHRPHMNGLNNGSVAADANRSGFLSRIFGQIKRLLPIG